MADNPDELFDVVDAEDRVIGVGRRADVHAKGLLHRAVHILVQCSTGELFLQQRSMEKDSHPGKWDSSASGHLDSGESYGTAALRELREELGIKVESLEEIGSLPASEATGQEFVKIYLARHEGPFVLHPEEISGGKWIAPTDLDRWIEADPGDFARCFLDVYDRSKPALA
jgi:16S rRNA (adenine1518-N6/adenine1519-N6)-dimethyltransferase